MGICKLLWWTEKTLSRTDSSLGCRANLLASKFHLHIKHLNFLLHFSVVCEWVLGEECLCMYAWVLGHMDRQICMHAHVEETGQLFVISTLLPSLHCSKDYVVSCSSNHLYLTIENVCAEKCHPAISPKAVARALRGLTQPFLVNQVSQNRNTFWYGDSRLYLSTGEAEAGLLWVWGHPELHSMF